jgi:RsiW-degrading membrane proteinase PrsW (M82 family)
MKSDEVTIQMHKPSINERLFFFVCGAVLSVPFTLFVEQFAVPLLVQLDSFYAALISVAVIAPFIEELSKVFPLYYRHGETQKSIFNLALLVGFGFGFVEFLTYTFVLNANPFDRIPGLFFHPASTSIAAYGIATKRPVPFYIIAVALHSCNNFLATLNLFRVPSTIIIVAATILISWKLHQKTKEEFVE